MSTAAVLAMLFPVIILVVVLGFALLMRYLKHREDMAMIQKGIAPPRAEEAVSRPHDGRGRLGGGLITAFVGLAITLGLLTLGWGPWLLGGLVPLFVGLATLLTYFLTDHRPRGAGSPPGAEKGGGA